MGMRRLWFRWRLLCALRRHMHGHGRLFRLADDMVSAYVVCKGGD